MKTHKKRWEVDATTTHRFFIYSGVSKMECKRILYRSISSVEPKIFLYLIKYYIKYYFNKKNDEKYTSLSFITKMIEFNPLISINFNALNKEVKSLSNET